MANAKNNSLVQMSRAEVTAGIIYLPVYLFLLSAALELLFGLIGIRLTDLQLNVLWFFTNLVIIWILFGKFLTRSFRAIRFWPLVQAVILGYVFYYAGNLALQLVTELLHLNIVSFNDNAIATLATGGFWILSVCTVIAAPIVEETLIRGVIFGGLRGKSRVAAYVVSILVFSLMHVWSYIPGHGIAPVLLSAVQYIPAGIALGWTYEKAGTIWASIAVHLLNNVISMSVVYVGFI